MSYEAAEFYLCGQRASLTDTESSGGGGKENPADAPLFFVQSELARDTTEEWEVDLQAGEVISIELQATTYDTRFRFFDIRGDQLGDTTYVQSNYVDDTFYGARLGVEVLETGTYSISVFNGIGPYTLQVLPGYFGQTIGTIQLGQSAQGSLGQNGFDRWLIEMSPLQTITLELQTTTYDGRLRFYDPDGNQYGDTVYIQSDYINGTYYGNQTAIQILEGGIYMIQVFNAIGPYTLTATEGVFGQSTGTIAVGQTLQGTLAENGFDRWVVALSEGQTIRVRVNATTYDTRFRVYDPDGDQFGDTRYAQQQQGTGYMAEGEYRILVTGLYMISVYSGIGDYGIIVSGS